MDGLIDNNPNMVADGILLNLIWSARLFDIILNSRLHIIILIT